MMHIYYPSLKLDAQQAANNAKHQTHKERHEWNKGQILANESMDWSAGE